MEHKNGGNRMRYTEYHQNIAVIKDKSLLSDALAKLAKYEDTEEGLNVDEVLQGLVKAKYDALSEYNKERIQNAIKLIIKLANHHASAESELIDRFWKELKDLLKFIDEVDGQLDPVSNIREYVEGLL